MRRSQGKIKGKSEGKKSGRERERKILEEALEGLTKVLKPPRPQLAVLPFCRIGVFSCLISL
jgi:hypothetical protein